MKSSYIKIILLIFFLLSGTFFYVYAYFIPDKREKEFLVILANALKSGHEEVKFIETPFEWDSSEILIDQNPSFLFGAIKIEDYLERKKIKFNFLDTFYLPRIACILGLEDDYRSVFVFIKNKHVVQLYRLKDFTITVDDTSYHLQQKYFDKPNQKQIPFFKVENKKMADRLLKEKLGIAYTADLVFYQHRED